MATTKTIDKSLQDAKQVTDVDFVMGTMANGEKVKISKADLATVVGGLNGRQFVDNIPDNTTFQLSSKNKGSILLGACVGGVPGLYVVAFGFDGMKVKALFSSSNNYLKFLEGDGDKGMCYAHVVNGRYAWLCVMCSTHSIDVKVVDVDISMLKNVAIQ